jgi:hypothetical protein
MNKSSGMNYAPKCKANLSAAMGTFPSASKDSIHGHINGMCNGLSEAARHRVGLRSRPPQGRSLFRQTFPGKDCPIERKFRRRCRQLVASAVRSRGQVRRPGMRPMITPRTNFTDKPRSRPSLRETRPGRSAADTDMKVRRSTTAKGSTSRPRSSRQARCRGAVGLASFKSSATCPHRSA